MELIINALIITVVGMGFVFFFLAIQVLVTLLSAKIAGKFAYLLPEPEKKKPAPKATASDDSEIVAAIAVALQNAR